MKKFIVDTLKGIGVPNWNEEKNVAQGCPKPENFDFEFRVSISSFDFEFRFRVSISSFDFEFRFRVLISSFDFEFRFRVSISSFDFEFRFRVFLVEIIGPVLVGSENKGPD